MISNKNDEDDEYEDDEWEENLCMVVIRRH